MAASARFVPAGDWNIVAPQLATAECLRRRTVWLVLGLTLLLLLTVAIPLNWRHAWLEGPEPHIFAVPVGCLAVVILLWTAIRRLKSHYRRQARQALAGSVAKLFDPSLRYCDNDGVDPCKVCASGLLAEVYDEYKCDQLLTGRFQQRQITAARLQLWRIEITTTTDSDGKTSTQRRRVLVYYGVVLLVSHVQRQTTPVLVLPHKAAPPVSAARAFLGEVLPCVGDTRWRRARMEHPEFGDRFHAYGQDDVDLFGVLRTDVVERLLELGRRWRSPRIRFEPSQVIVALPDVSVCLEPPLWTTLLDPRLAERQYLRLHELLTSATALSVIKPGQRVGACD